MMDGLNQWAVEMRANIDGAADEATLEGVRVAALGKKSALSLQLKQLGQMDAEERRQWGPRLNGLREELSQRVAARRETLRLAEMERKIAQEWGDITLPPADDLLDRGRVHPIAQVSDELAAIFADLGFSIAEGPDIETDYYNFSALNFADGHPAREMHDTFFLPASDDGEKRLLRTHTSPVQIRTMKVQAPPIRIVAPGRTYRCDSDQTHTPMFHQLEGLVVDETSHLGHLKWILQEFCKAFFEIDDVKMRFRPSFFPFTEPSMEVDINCRRDGRAIEIGQGDDWLEILGCGMVHPNVLAGVGLDPDRYQGFAWGMGIDRLAMLKYGMPDLRAFFDADMRWIDHYGFRPLDLPHLARGLSR